MLKTYLKPHAILIATLILGVLSAAAQEPEWTTLTGKVTAVRHGKADFYTFEAADGAKYVLNAANPAGLKYAGDFKQALENGSTIEIEFRSHENHPGSIWWMNRLTVLDASDAAAPAADILAPAPVPEPAHTVGRADNLPPPVDLTTWDLASWRAWPFAYEELGTSKTPLVTKDAVDWIHAGDSWVAENKPKTSGDAPAPAPRTPPFENLKVTEFYITGGGDANGPNRIYCATAVPDGIPGPFPVLFVFHGGGGHASSFLAVASARNNPGFATVAVDYNGQFTPSKNPVTKWVTQTASLRERKLDLDPNPLNFPMYHNVQAARRVLDWTQEQSWADAKNFGAVGISYGGWVSYFLGGLDERITSVLAQMSAAGTEGMRGNACQPHDWAPQAQVPVWIAHADPIAYAGTTRAPVFMRIAANDRFFWLDGAANQREAFGGTSSWLILPNSDHGNGGPDLPDPHGLWHRSVYFGETSLPSFEALQAAGGSASVVVKAERPLKSVHLAWSPGDAVSPARYWCWIEARENGGTWTAKLPAGHAELQGTLYFTAIDADGRAASSDLLRKPGRGVGPALEWRDGCLWDIEAGAGAWRSNLSFDKGQIVDSDVGRVKMTPLKPGKKTAFFTNSFIVNEAARQAHRGIRIELDGRGVPGKTRILLARDYLSLDQQLQAAEVELDGGLAEISLSWEAFKPYGPKAGAELFPVNALVVESESLPAEGISVGTVRWLD